MRHRRGGHSLVEMLVAIMLLGTLLGTVTVAVSGMFRADQTMRDALARDGVLERFSAQFRSDVHQAVSAALGEDPAAGELTLEGANERATRYTVEPQKIQRVVKLGETTVHRETYDLVAKGWKIEKDNGAPLVALLLPDGMRVDAVVNLGRGKR